MMNNRSKGAVGEDIACKFLKERGFVILARNYLKKWGELDIICQKDGRLHFFEVKSAIGVSAHVAGSYSPEEKVDWFKCRQIRRMIETYLAEQGITRETEFYFHVLSVHMDLNSRRARVKWIKNVIL